MRNCLRATGTPPFAALKGIAASLVIGTSLAGFGATALADGDPLNFSLPTGYVTYGDANSYALQVACTVTGLGNSACPWYVQSSPGTIDSLVVNGTGPSGGPITTNFPGMDDAYSLPNSPNNPSINQLSDWFVRTGGQTIGSGQSAVTFGSTDPGGAGQFTGDLANTWDTTLGALKTYLTAPTGTVGAPVIFFNNNQTNSGTAADQTLAAWARVWITGPNGQVLGTWDFTNNGGLYAPVPFGGGVINGNVGNYTTDYLDPLVSPNTQQTDYVLSGGQVCIDNTTKNIVACGSANSSAINNNLGANQAAYAIVFPEMNAVLGSLWGLSDLTGYSLHADFRLGCDPAWYGSDPTATATIEAQCVAKRLTNGYEQIFMGRMFEGQQVPEPSALALAALGLIGLGLISRRRRQS